MASGKNNERRCLLKAIDCASRDNAILLVAKLDRLSRKVSFVAKLLEDKKLSFKVA